MLRMNTLRRSCPIGALALAAILAGCSSAPSRIPEPPTPLQLLSSADLEIDASCEVDGAVLIEYTVLASGETANIELSSAPDCARTALADWVASYRYVPPTRDVSARFEWILVSASRGSSRGS